jgi:putative ABC transport system ATP-binding protein
MRHEFHAGPVAARCRDVVKTYGDGETKVRALDGVDLDARFGEMTLLVGPSGCGKTTLICIVAGLLDATSGEVEVLGQSRNELRGGRLTRFRAENIGFVFQQYNLLPSLTAAENAAVPLLINHVPRAEAVRRAEIVLRDVGLGDKINSKPSQLSGGQQQRVAIARALVHHPRLLVCDEPTAALDAKAGRTVMELLRRVALQEDRAVIVVTHDSRVYEFGDRIVEMSDGKVVRVEETAAAGAVA